jgi:hypothetical protein
MTGTMWLGDGITGSPAILPGLHPIAENLATY